MEMALFFVNTQYIYVTFKSRFHVNPRPSCWSPWRRRL